MILVPIENGWRIELDTETAVEFTELSKARDFADMIENGILPKKALLRVMRRRQRKEKREQQR